VHLGFNRDVESAEIAEWVATQATEPMLASMNQLELVSGDAVLVPAGTAHVIGEGLFVLEVQEPADLSIFLEWDGFALDGPADGHLGLGFDVALTALDRRGWSRAEVAALVKSRQSAEGSLLPGAENFFQAERWRGGGVWEPGFAVVVVLAGSGKLVPESGDRVALGAGRTYLVAHAAGSAILEASSGLELIRFLPPR
jgi:mannose-6-phosphate isomerase